MSNVAILIAEPESISAGASPMSMTVDDQRSPPSPTSSKEHRTSTSERPSGRLPDKTTPLLHSISSISSCESGTLLDAPEVEKKSGEQGHQHGVRQSQHASHTLLQVVDWLRQEKARNSASRAAIHRGHAKLSHAADATRALANQFRSDGGHHHQTRHRRRSAEASEDNLALNRLEQILSAGMKLKEENPATPTDDKEKGGSYFPRRKSTRKGSKNVLRKTSTVHLSDSDQQESELNVPSVEVILDNSKTLGYTGGIKNVEVDLRSANKRALKEKEAWHHFKGEIVRLTHTLKISGWRRVPLDRGAEIDVERLSGALTNAVYVVSPPRNLPQTPAITQERTSSLVPKKPPP